MPKIGIVIRALSIGGAEKQALLLAKALQDKHETYLFIQKETPLDSKHLDFINKEKINHIFLKGKLLARRKQLRDFVKDNEIDHLFSYLSLDNLLVASCFFSKKKVTTVGGIRNSLLPLHKFWISLLLHHFFLDYVLFNNYSGRDAFLKKGFIRRKTLVIPNCIDHKLTPRTLPKSEVTEIITIGRFTESKDYSTALYTIKTLQESGLKKKISYTIAGYGKLEKKIRLEIESLNLENVRILIKPKNLEDIYRNAHIYFCSSIFEGMPNTIMEALNYSLPVVTTNVGDNTMLIKDGVSGYVVEKKDYVKMAEKIGLLVNDPKRISQFGKQGNEYLHKNFSFEAFKENYLNLIQSLTHKK